MNRDDAYTLVTEWTTNKNLIKHMLAVEATMRTLCAYFYDKGVLAEESQGNTKAELIELWGIAGLVHDADYEMFKDDPKKHPSKVFEALSSMDADQRIVEAVRAHAWGWRDDLPKPTNYMQWSIYCCDELTGFIIACALVRPDKSLSSVTVDSVMKKWPQKSFAAGVHREQIEYCEDELGVPLEEFISLTLSALQDIHEDLGL